MSYDDEASDPRPKGWVKKYGNARIPNSSDLRAWSQGKLDHGLAPRSTPSSRREADHQIAINPITGAWRPWWVEWIPKPPGYSPWEALRKSLFKGSGDPMSRAHRAGRKGGASRSERKQAAARQNGWRGGRVCSLAKAEAARVNGRLGGRPRRAAA